MCIHGVVYVAVVTAKISLCSCVLVWAISPIFSIISALLARA